jgi:hypothetical protein
VISLSDDRRFQSAVKAVFKNAGRLLLKKLLIALKLTLAKLLFFLAVVALCIGLLIVAFSIMFELPRIAAEEGLRVVFGMHLDDQKEAERLHATYESLTEKWDDELDAWQQYQAREYRLSAGVLAAVDQAIGEHYNERWRSRAGEIYDALKPEFAWEEQETTVAITYEATFIDEYGNPYTVILTSTHRVPHKDLENVRTFEGRFVFRYEESLRNYGARLPAKPEYDLTGISQIVAGYTNIISIEVEGPLLQNVEHHGPHFVPLKNLARRHGIKPEDYEKMLHLAKAYDPEYEARSYGFDLLLGELYNPAYVYRGPQGSLVWPAVSRNITSGFGRRRHPIRGVPHFHGGIDIADVGINRTPVFAAMNGEVVFAGISGSLGHGYGRLVIIAHGNLGAGNVTTYYAHLSSIKVRRGDTVSAGDIIGRVGTTGGSTGPHLHFEYRVNNIQKPPLLLFGGMTGGN